MPLRTSTQVKNRVQSPSFDGAYDALPVYAEHTVVAGQFLANDVIELIPFPAGSVPMMIKAHIEDLDTGAAVLLDFGVLSGLYGDADVPARTCNSVFGAALATGQAGGSVDVAAAQMLNIAPTQTDRSIGFRVATAPAGLIAGAKIRVAALFAPTPQGVAIV